MDEICLSAERVDLRRFRAEDGEQLHAYLSLPEVVRFEPYEVFSRETSRAEALQRSRNPAFWAVELREEKRLIGNLYFQQRLPESFLTWELGYVFHPDYQKRGYATESIQCLLSWAISNLPLHRIVAECNPENVSSWRLLERLGFRREAHLHRNAFFRMDASGAPLWFDTYIYALLREEWQGSF